MSGLSDRLKKARERKNFRQTQVKEKTGIHNKTLSGYETGRNEPDYETLVTLSVLYGVKVQWLLTGEDAADQQIDESNKKTLSVSTKEFLEFLELSDEEAFEKLKSRLTFKGKVLTEEQIKKIISHARFVASEDQLDI